MPKDKYDPSEQDDIISRFVQELWKVTADGGNKRRDNVKPPWFEDNSHYKAALRHIVRWRKGELVDPDSGAHPLVHAAWRLLAIACTETGNTP